MDYDFGVMFSNMIGVKLLTMEVGVKPNGKPVYRVALFSDGEWTGVLYQSLQTAVNTYRFLMRVL